MLLCCNFIHRICCHPRPENSWLGVKWGEREGEKKREKRGICPGNGEGREEEEEKGRKRKEH